jgi:hypothetical protein
MVGYTSRSVDVIKIPLSMAAVGLLADLRLGVIYPSILLVLLTKKRFRKMSG